MSEPTAHGDAEAHAPSPWPVRLAWLGMGLCLVLAGASWVRVTTVAALHEQAAAELAAAVDRPAPPQGERALQRRYRRLRLQRAAWERYRLGFALTAIVLAVGANIGSGLLHLHTRLPWRVIDAPADEEKAG